MPRFRFEATDAAGAPRQGEREAKGPAELAVELEAAGWTVLDIGPGEENGPGGVLNDGEARLLAEHVAGLTAGQAPLAPGLRALAEELDRGRVRSLVLDLARRLEAGESFAEALEAEGGRLPGHLRGLLLAGARSGQVGIVLGEFVGYSQVGIALRRSLWVGLAYPLVLLFLFALVVVLLCTYVISGFSTIFADFGIDLPMATKLLVQASDAIAEHGLRVLAVPFIVGIVAWVAGRLLLDRASRRRMLCKVPLFGPLWRLTAMAEFSHFLALLTEAGLPLGTAIPLAAEGANDAELEESGRGMERAIAAGATLAQAAEAAPGLPAGFAKVLAWAEGHQSLPETLHMAGEIFEAHARTRAAFVSGLVTVLTVIIVLWGCAFMVGALFLPLINLISRLSG
jgi:general secretion pathway protein F